MVSQTPKQRVTQLLQRLPDDASFDEIQHQLYQAELIRKRIAQSDDPHTQLLSNEEAKERLSKWLTD